MGRGRAFYFLHAPKRDLPFSSKVCYDKRAACSSRPPSFARERKSFVLSLAHTHNGADLGKDPVRRLLFQMALPSILAQLINLLYNLVDRMYIGHIPDVGATALTGVGVTMPLILCISAFAALVSMGGAPRASILLGKGEKDQAEQVLGNCTTMLVITALVLTVVVQVFGPDLLLFFGASQATLPYAWDYTRIYAMGTLFVQLALGLNAFINAQGFARTGMLTVALGAGCNIVLDPIFIFALDMGVQGAALATVLSQGISCVWVISFLRGKKTLLRLEKAALPIRPRLILPCVALGTAAFIMQASESVISVCFNASLLKYGGDIAVGAMTILTSVMQFAMLPLQGIGQGAQPITSYNFGAKKRDRMLQTMRYGLIIGISMMAVGMLIFWIFPRQLLGIFAPTPELMEMGVPALRTISLSFCLGAVSIILSTVFQAVGKGVYSLYISLLRQIVVVLPCAWALSFLGLEYVWFAFPVSNVVSMALSIVMARRLFRNYIDPILLDKGETAR